MEFTDVMIDLETMSTESNSAIISIGAYAFNRTQDDIFKTFYRNVDLQSSIDAGLNVSGSTVMWWLEQEQASREVLKHSPIRLIEALAAFSMWLPKEIQVWGNGANFDNVVLRNAYNSQKVKCPYSYRQDACYRTIRLMYPQIETERVGTYHNALDDAKSQAFHLIELLKHAGKAND